MAPVTIDDLTDSRGRLRRGLYPATMPDNEQHMRALARLAGGCWCWYCGESLTIGDTATIDHVVPRSRGGRRVLSNERLSCRTCNSSKGASTPDEWAARLESAAA